MKKYGFSPNKIKSEVSGVAKATIAKPEYPMLTCANNTDASYDKLGQNDETKHKT